MQPENKQQLKNCNLCGKESDHGYWQDNYYKSVDVEVHMIKSSHYGDCGEGTTYLANICGECFEQKLIPFLESEGSKAKTKEWNY